LGFFTAQFALAQSGSEQQNQKNREENEHHEPQGMK